MMNETLSLICRVRFSPEQWANIEEQARLCGLTPSTYVRMTALKITPQVRRRAREADVVYQLARIGNNLNQIARRHNSQEPVARTEVLAVLEEIRDALRRF